VVTVRHGDVLKERIGQVLGTAFPGLA